MKTLILVLSLSTILSGCAGVTNLPLSPEEQTVSRNVGSAVAPSPQVHASVDSRGRIVITNSVAKAHKVILTAGHFTREHSFKQ